MTVSPMQKFEATEAISQLKASYFRFVDAKDWAALSKLFSAGATIDVPLWQEPKSVTDAMAAFEASMSPVESIHAGFMPVIVVETDAAASAIWQMEDRLYTPHAHNPGFSALMHGFGRYHETYVREGSHWLISSMRLERRRKDYYKSVRSVQSPTSWERQSLSATLSDPSSARSIRVATSSTRCALVAGSWLSWNASGT